MSFSIEKILVPVDLSENSLNALDTAVSLSKKHAAELVVLNIVEPKLSASDEVFDVSTFSNSKDVLSALLGSIQHAHEIMPILNQKEGVVFEQIIKTSFSVRASLIVMGSHGASGYREGFLGSNTYAVMKHSFCPVLSIPPRKKYQSFRKILFPIRPVSGALSKYDVLCHFLNPESIVDVLGLSFRKMERETNVLNKIADEIKDQAERDKIKIKTKWGKGEDIVDDVIEHAQQTTPDIVVVTNVLDVTTKPGFLGPHTQKIVNFVKVPVLSIKSVGTPHYA